MATVIPYFFQNLQPVTVNEEEEVPSDEILTKVRSGTPCYKEICWSDLSIECLLNAYMDKKLNRDRGILGDRDWEEIAAIVDQHNQCGTTSGKQCKSKLDYMKKIYRNELGEMNRCDSTVSRWPWFEKIEQICTNLAPGKHISDEDEAVNAAVSSSPSLLRQSKRKRLSAGDKNQKFEKMLEDSPTSLCTMTEERDHLNQAYNEGSSLVMATGQNSQSEGPNRIEVEEKEPSDEILREVRIRTPWNDLLIECLLNAYMDKKLNLDRRTLRGRDWEEIAAIVTQHNQCGTKSVRQCKNMIDKMKRRYRNELGERNRCGSTVSRWPWFEKIEQICTNLAPGKHISDEDEAVNAAVSSSPNLLRQSQRKRFRLSTGEKNQKLVYMEKMLEDSSTSLCTTTEERDHLNHAYNEESRKMKKAMEIEKCDAQLGFKGQQLLVLKKLNVATQASRKFNTVQGKREGVATMSSQDKVQVQIDINGLQKELEKKDSELDKKLNQKQTLVVKEHKSNPDLQEARNASIEKVTKEDDEKSIELIDGWGKGDNEDSGGLECNAFQDMFPPIPAPEYLADLCNDMPDNSSDLSSLLPVSDDEDAELESLTAFIEDSLLAGDSSPDGFTDNIKKDESRRFCTLKPVSVLSSSFSGGETTPLILDAVGLGHVQSRCTRPSVSNQALALNLVSPPSCRTNVRYANSYLASESENLAESHPSYTPKVDGKEQKKGNKKKKLQQQQQSVVAVKKCSHCEITTAPMWRRGPMGPSTLCNACGVRFRLGRLCPEYRPAASPTFEASLHSNYQQKILETMRVKATPD